MFICCKTVITYFFACSPANRSAHEFPVHHDIYCLLLPGLLEMLSSCRPNSTAHLPCHHVTCHLHKVAYLILGLFSFLPRKRWLWNYLKTIVLLCVAVMKEHLGCGAQIAGSSTREDMENHGLAASENRYIMLF